jgi:DNA-binding GntR family transcriptional regulator
MLSDQLLMRNFPSRPFAATKAQAVYVEIRFRILKGVLEPGLLVNQESLAASLGVSITPLREALRRLEMEGLVRLEAHRTVIITPLTGRELHEIYVIRTELDALAAGIAAITATEADLDTIGRLARQKAVNDPVVQLERNRVFHRSVYSSSGNESLTSLLDQLWDRTDRYRLILVKEELVEGSTSRQDHIEIANAIIARQSKRAARLTREHIARAHTRIARVLATLPSKANPLLERAL